MSEPRPLHRLFDLSWTDHLEASALDLEAEMDLSLKQQFLDLVLIRKRPGPIPPLPDGFEDLSTHNLITFKSHQETLDGWALSELIGHYVNYRKQSSPSFQDLLPESEYRLFAVSARYPNSLLKQVPHTRLQEGVYEVRLGTVPVRIIVASQLPLQEHNAMLHLFSGREELLRYAREHYRPRSQQTSTLLYKLFKVYSEDPEMPDQLKEFVRQSIDELLQSLPAEELRKRLSVEERLKGLPVEERLKGLPVEERLKGLSVEEVIRVLPPEVADALARKLKANGSSAEPP